MYEGNEGSRKEMELISEILEVRGFSQCFQNSI